MGRKPAAWQVANEMQPDFEGGLIQNQFIQGTLFIFKTIAQRNAMPEGYRQLDGETTTMAFISNTKQLFQLIANPSGVTTDTDWEEIPLSGDAMKPVGNWDSTTGIIEGGTVQLLDTDADDNNGDFYIVTNAAAPNTQTYPGLFQSQEVTTTDQDWVLSVGNYYTVVTQGGNITWDTLPGKPQTINDYVAGNVQAHNQAINTITGLQTELNAKLDTSDFSDYSDLEQYFVLPDTGVLTHGYGKGFFYKKYVSGDDKSLTTYSAAEIDNIAVGGGIAALQVSYDNSDSALASINVKDALDELDGLVAGGGTAWKVAGESELTGTPITISMNGAGTQFLRFEDLDSGYVWSHIETVAKSSLMNFGITGFDVRAYDNNTQTGTAKERFRLTEQGTSFKSNVLRIEKTDNADIAVLQLNASASGSSSFTMEHGILPVGIGDNEATLVLGDLLQGAATAYWSLSNRNTVITPTAGYLIENDQSVFTVTDYNASPKGIEYGGDYSATMTSLSLIHKGFADGAYWVVDGATSLSQNTTIAASGGTMREIEISSTETGANSKTQLRLYDEGTTAAIAMEADYTALGQLAVSAVKVDLAGITLTSNDLFGAGDVYQMNMDAESQVWTFDVNGTPVFTLGSGIFSHSGGVVLANLASDPVSVEEAGMIYFNTAGQIKYYDGASWITSASFADALLANTTTNLTSDTTINVARRTINSAMFRLYAEGAKFNDFDMYFDFEGYSSGGSPEMNMRIENVTAVTEHGHFMHGIFGTAPDNASGIYFTSPSTISIAAESTGIIVRGLSNTAGLGQGRVIKYNTNYFTSFRPNQYEIPDWNAIQNWLLPDLLRSDLDNTIDNNSWEWHGSGTTNWYTPDFNRIYFGYNSSSALVPISGGFRVAVGADTDNYATMSVSSGTFGGFFGKKSQAGGMTTLLTLDHSYDGAVGVAGYGGRIVIRQRVTGTSNDNYEAARMEGSYNASAKAEFKLAAGRVGIGGTELMWLEQDGGVFISGDGDFARLIFYTNDNPSFEFGAKVSLSDPVKYFTSNDAGMDFGLTLDPNSTGDVTGYKFRPEIDTTLAGASYTAFLIDLVETNLPSVGQNTVLLEAKYDGSTKFQVDDEGLVVAINGVAVQGVINSLNRQTGYHLMNGDGGGEVWMTHQRGWGYRVGGKEAFGDIWAFEEQTNGAFDPASYEFIGGQILIRDKDNLHVNWGTIRDDFNQVYAPVNGDILAWSELNQGWYIQRKILANNYPDVVPMYVRQTTNRIKHFVDPQWGSDPAQVSDSSAYWNTSHSTDLDYVGLENLSASFTLINGFTNQLNLAGQGVSDYFDFFGVDFLTVGRGQNAQGINFIRMQLDGSDILRLGDEGYFHAALLDRNTGDEVAFDLSATVNKSASGAYTGLKLNVTETTVYTGNILMDLQVGGVSMFSVSPAGALTAPGALTIADKLTVGENGDSVSTTDATVTTCGTFTLEDNTVYQVEADIVGRRTNGAGRAGYVVTALVYRAGGGATLEGSVNSINGTPRESDTAWNATLDVSVNDIRVRVTGVAGQNIDWTSVFTKITKVS